MNYSGYTYTVTFSLNNTPLVLGLAGLSAAQTLSSPDASPPTTEIQQMLHSPCGFVGDNNTYGLGIRLGIYLQWITSGIAYNFVPEEAVTSTMRSVNYFFAVKFH